jgi:tRNA (uracil-5-)-methyltransferase
MIKYCDNLIKNPPVIKTIKEKVKIRDYQEEAIQLIKDMYQGDVEVFESERSHYRMRANFNIWKDIKPNNSKGKNYNSNNQNHSNEADPNIYYSMFDESKNACEIKSFPRGSILMNELMQKLLKYITTSKILQDKLFEVRFVTTLSNNALIVMIYRRPIDDEWEKEAHIVYKDLNVKIIGRSRKIKIIVGHKSNIDKNSAANVNSNNEEIVDDGETIEEILNVNGNALKYYQTEGAFSQPNAKVCEKMLKWSLDVTNNSNKDADDLLELYCGGGTFTAALASNFHNVIATEISKASVVLAHKTFKANNITNIKVARLSSEEFTEAYHNKREFQRLRNEGINNLNDYNITTVLVDPPRAGLDINTCQLIAKFNKILYISCNPETLARDLRILTKTHDILKCAAFDQFPYTHHLECGIYLEKKSDNNNNNNDDNNDINNNDNDNNDILGKRKAIDIERKMIL